MNDWESKLNSSLQFNDREILYNTGSITAKLAKEITDNNNMIVMGRRGNDEPRDKR